MLRCTLRLPAIDEERSLTAAWLPVVRRFINKQVAGLAASVLDTATFTISLEMRAPNHGARWRPICRWREGDSINEVFKRAATVISSIPREPEHNTQHHRGLVKSRALLRDRGDSVGAGVTEVTQGSESERDPQ